MRFAPWAAALALIATAAAGCARTPAAEPQAPPPSPKNAVEAEFYARAQVVADAWRRSDKSIWTTGLRSGSELTIFDIEGFPDGATKLAAMQGNFRLDTDLPGTSPASGTVAFPDGSTMSVKLIGAQQAYEALTAQRVDCVSDYQCTTLSITGATLTTWAYATSRGEATVPAWAFTVAQLPGARIIRVAVEPSQILPLPALAVGQFTPTEPILGAMGVKDVDGKRIDYTVAGGCGSNERPLVWESADVIVLGTAYDRSPNDVCDLVLRSVPLTATVSRPLDGRVILDGPSGRPLRLP